MRAKHAYGQGAVVVLVGVALVGIVAVTTAWTSARSAAPVYLYWGDGTLGSAKHRAGTTIGRVRLDGTGVEQSFVSGTGRRPCGVALDRKHIYWTEVLDGPIGRANRNGSGVNTSFIPPPVIGCGVAIAGGHIYWANGGAIGRANVDGTGVDRQFIPGLGKHTIPRGGSCGIAVAGKYIYWGHAGESLGPATIGRANLDGTGVNKRFITGLTNGCGIAVAGGHIYWENEGPAAGIGRANLDGTGVTRRFIRTASRSCGIAVYQGHIYWGQSTGGGAHPSATIGRANLDGSAVNNQFITGIHDSCGGLAIG